MIRNFTQAFAPVLCLAMLAVGGRADAASQTYTATLSPSITDFSTQLTVPAFNPKLGTLQSVSISFTDTGNFSGTVTNTSSSAQTFTVYEESDISLVGPGVNVGSTVSKSPLSLIATQTYTSLGTNVTGSFGPMTANGGAGPLAISSGPGLTAFIAPSPVSFTMTTLTSVSISGGGGNIHTKITTLAGATLNVQYNYTPFAIVPEPASFVMMGLGLSGMGAFGLVRKNRRTIA